MWVHVFSLIWALLSPLAQHSYVIVYPHFIQVFYEQTRHIKIKAPFVLASNWFRKCFSGKVDVWLLLKIRSNWKCFQFDRKIRLRGRKIIYVLIFTSNHFHPKKIEERERQQGREIALAPQHQRRRDRSTSKSSDEPRKPKTELVRRAMPKERERAREGRTQTCKHREREIASLNPFLRSQTQKSSNPKIVKPIRHQSSRTQKSSNPFATDRREPRNRRTIRQTRDRPTESSICLL